jgi:hypothetical protein
VRVPDLPHQAYQRGDPKAAWPIKQPSKLAIEGLSK